MLLCRTVILAALLSNLALLRLLQGSVSSSCPPQRDILTPPILLVGSGTAGLCSQGRCSQQVDGPVGDNLIVVICQRPLASPVPGTLLSTKPRDQRAEKKPTLEGKSYSGGLPLVEAHSGLQPGTSQDPRS